jgi:hypothetical protein
MGVQYLRVGVLGARTVTGTAVLCVLKCVLIAKRSTAQGAQYSQPAAMVSLIALLGMQEATSLAAQGPGQGLRAGGTNCSGGALARRGAGGLLSSSQLSFQLTDLGGLN